VSEFEAEPGDIEKPATDWAKLAKKWRAEIAQAEKNRSKWVDRGKKVEKIYADERDLSTARSRKFNILWSNVETLRPAVYMQTPKAQAVRRYRDRDPVARFASMLIERCVQTSCEMYDFDAQMEACVRDRLLPGMGQAWVMYDPEMYGEGDEEDVAYYNVRGEYLPWQDFLFNTCRTWNEVRWVARRFYKTREELKGWLTEKNSPLTVEQVQLDYSAEGSKAEDGLKDERSKAMIWEVWDKDSKQVLFVAPGSNENAILAMMPPPVMYRDFWPCPRPLLATTTSKSLIPTPDYALYQDQAEELNRITERIGVLQKALKVAGLYDEGSPEVQRLITATDSVMIPVKKWAMFSEGGGAKGRIEWFPVDQVAEVLKGLYEIREQAKQTLYEVSGIGDILRGSTDPDETATAQGIKAQWGSLRVRRVQKDVQRFAADLMRLKAEVVSEQFPFPEIMRMAGVDQELIAKYAPAPKQEQPQLPPDLPPEQAEQVKAALAVKAKEDAMAAQQQFLMEVERLLRDDVARTFRVDVESDSTLEPDEMAEKQARTEFTQAITMFMKEAAPVVTSSPATAKLLGDLLTFTVRGYKKADQLEQAIEQWSEEMQQQASQPRPDPAAQEFEMRREEGQQKLEMKREETNAKIQGEMAKTQAQIEGQQMKTQAELAINAQSAEQNMNIQAQNAAAKMAMMNGAPPNA
jgi:hypothetical protein